MSLGSQIVAEPTQSFHFPGIGPENPELRAGILPRVDESLSNPVVKTSIIDLQVGRQIRQPPFVRSQFVAGEKRLARPQPILNRIDDVPRKPSRTRHSSLGYQSPLQFEQAA